MSTAVELLPVARIPRIAGYLHEALQPKGCANFADVDCRSTHVDTTGCLWQLLCMEIVSRSKLFNFSASLQGESLSDRDCVSNENSDEASSTVIQFPDTACHQMDGLFVGDWEISSEKLDQLAWDIAAKYVSDARLRMNAPNSQPS